MANEVIGIEVAVKLDQLRAQLATLGPGMEKEAAAMTAALGKQLKAQTAAVKSQMAGMAAAQRTGLATVAAQADITASKAGKAVQALGPLSGVLNQISPSAGAAVAGLAAISGAAASAQTALAAMAVSMAVVLVPVGVAVAVVAGTYAVLSRNLAAAEAAQKAQTDEAERAGKIFGGLGKTLSSVESDNAIAFGKTSSSIQKMQGELETLNSQYRAASQETLSAAGAQEALDDRFFRARGILEYRIKLEKDALAGGKAGTKGTKDQTKAVKDHADALKLVNDEMARQGAMAAAAESAFAGALSALAAQEKSAKAAVASKAEAIELDHKAAIAVADAERAEASRHAEAISAKETIDEQYRQTVSALDVKYYANLAALREADATAATAATDAARAAAQATADEESAAQRDKTQMYASTTGSVVGSVTGLYDELLQNRLAGIDTESAAGKKAAMAVWEEQKGLAIASTTLQAIVAIAMAAASAPPPANIPAIVMSTVAGAASVAAAVAAPAPKFAAGGFPDERTITAHAGEAILSRQGRAAMGDDAIQAANAGRMDAGPAVSQIVYKHRAFDYFVADHLQLDGSLARTIRRGDRVGQLRRGRG